MTLPDPDTRPRAAPAATPATGPGRLAPAAAAARWLGAPEALLDVAVRAARGEGAATAPALDPAVVTAIRREAARVLDALEGDALLAALDAVLCAPDPAAGLELLRALGVVSVALPEVAALVAFHHGCDARHKDLWAHTLEVVAQTDPDPDLRWVALLHDVGKVATRHVGDDGAVSFLRHERVSAWLARGVGARLGMPAARVERIAFVIEHHARVNAYDPAWTDRAVRRLVRDAGDRLDDLIRFSSADFTTRRERRRRRIRAQLDALRARVDAVRTAAALDPALAPGVGGAVAAQQGPGPHVGHAVRWLTAEVEAGRLPRPASVDACLAHLALYPAEPA